MLTSWTLSKALLYAILNDNVTDRFVVELVWERLGYEPYIQREGIWVPGKKTPINWSQIFPNGPEIIADRKASVHLTRSIPKQYKQLLKQVLNFSGYQIGELYPRRTRRATAVNWLLAWTSEHDEELAEEGSLPEFKRPPTDPIKGHPGDLPVN